jgi:eukaryotic-like serine/threonine-protein kinase
MGRVLLAHDPVLDRDVAIKVLRDDLRLGPDQLAQLIDRMRHEARAGARVLHPNIVALFDMGEDQELGLYLVFEYVAGPTLKDELESHPFASEAAAKLAREVGGALSTAHAAGVLHRDVKPENVILAQSGAKVADFGIARIPNSTLTRDGGVLGTPAYSSPESVEQGTFSAASDQFSFAASMYEALSGQRAFPGEDATAVAQRIALGSPEPIAKRRKLDPRVDQVLFRALAKDPSARFPSAEDFGRALADALTAAPRAALPTLPDERHRQDTERANERRQLWAAIGGFVIGSAMTAGGFLLIGNDGAHSELARPLDAAATGQSSTPTSDGATNPPPRRRVAPLSRPRQREIPREDARSDGAAGAAAR